MIGQAVYARTNFKEVIFYNVRSHRVCTLRIVKKTGDYLENGKEIRDVPYILVIGTLEQVEKDKKKCMHLL
jgi:hypothetical protein